MFIFAPRPILALWPAQAHFIKQQRSTQHNSSSDRSVRHQRASREHVSARNSNTTNYFLYSKMLVFVTLTVLLASANAKFWTDCGNYFNLLLDWKHKTLLESGCVILVNYALFDEDDLFLCKLSMYKVVQTQHTITSTKLMMAYRIYFKSWLWSNIIYIWW